MHQNIKSNIRKTFAYILTNRRHFIILISVYFLMQPDATQQMLGYSMSLGMLTGFILEVPSGYISDRLGHKKTLIIAKRAMLMTTICYILADIFPSVIRFFIASVFISFSFAFVSGTLNAFMHETLTITGQDKKYSSIMSKIKGNVSLIQTITFLTFPMVAQYNFMIPFYIMLVVDIFGLIIAYSFVQPKLHIDTKPHKNLFQIMKGLNGTGFYPLTIFFGFLGSFLAGFSAFREPFMLSIGYTVFFIGTISAGSRLTRRFLSKFVERIHENITLKQLMIFETCFFALYFILVAIYPNIYFVGILLALGLGYRYARSPIINQYLIEALEDKRYKATMLSVKAQLGGLFAIVTPILLGYLVTLDINFGLYRDGLFIWGILLFILLGSTLLYAIRNDSFPEKQKN